MACKLINGNAMKVSNNFFKGHNGKKFNCCCLLLKGFQTSSISYSTFIKKSFKKIAIQKIIPLLLYFLYSKFSFLGY